MKSRLSVESTSTPLPGNRRSLANTPTHSDVCDWYSCNLEQTPSSMHSNGCHTLTPSSSLNHTELYTDSLNENCSESRKSSSSRLSQRHGRNWTRTEEALPRSNFEQKNLLKLFEEAALEGQPWVQSCQLTFRDFFWWGWRGPIVYSFCCFVTILKNLSLTSIWNKTWMWGNAIRL